MQHELIDKVFDLNKYGAGVTKEITTNSHLIKLPIHPCLLHQCSPQAPSRCRKEFCLHLYLT